MKFTYLYLKITNYQLNAPYLFQQELGLETLPFAPELEASAEAVVPV